MKRFIKFMLGAFVFALACVSTSTITSCSRPSNPTDKWFKEKLDQHLPQAMQNLYSFEDVTDVMLYKQERGTQLYIDSVFTSMTDQEVANVVSVLKKEQTKFGVSDIVYEYNANRRIYQNLPTSTPSTTDQPTITQQNQPDPPVATNDSSIKITYVPLKRE